MKEVRGMVNFKFRNKSQKPSTIDGENIRLRPISVRDSAMIFDLYNSENKFNTFWLGSYPTVDDITMKTMDLVTSINNAKYLGWAIETKNDKLFLGLIGVFNYKEISKLCNLDLFVSLKEEYFDYIKDAISLISDYLFDSCGFHRIQIKTINYTSPIHNIINDCGFSYEGIQRDRLYQNEKFWDLKTFAKLESDRKAK